MSRRSSNDHRTSLPRPDAVIFDMDGVLFDTEILYLEAAILAGDELGFAIPQHVTDATVGLSWTNTRRLFVEHFGAAFPLEPYIDRWLVRFDELAATRLGMKPGVIEIIDMLDELAIPRAIATGSPLTNTRQHLAKHGLTDRFHVLVTSEDYAIGKPSPEPFLKAAERLGVDPRNCIAIEDSHNGVRSASAAEMMVIMVPDLVAPNDEVHALCHHVATDLHEVCQLIGVSLPLTKRS